MLTASSDGSPSRGSLARARAILRAHGPKLRARRAWIYWTDLLTTGAVAWASLVLAVREPGVSGALALALAVLAFHRGVSFLHELSHVRYAVPGFDFAWNAIFGVPLLLPSFVYTRVHTDHHAGAVFGTARDPEYAWLAGTGVTGPLMLVAGSALAPLVLAVRWLVVAPLSLVHPAVRSFVVRRVSSLTGKLGYTRTRPSGIAAVRFCLLEATSTAWAWSFALGLASGVLPLRALGCAIVLAIAVSTLQAARSLATHRATATGEPVGLEAQFLDSVNFVGHPILTELWAPAGLRYHALHHIAPDLPYHALGRAHRILEAELPADDVYHRATVRSIADVAADLAKVACEGTRVVLRAA